MFSTLRDLRCSQCQADLPHGSFLLIENREPLCLTCAELDHLVYVPRGSPAEPRRSETQHTVRRRCPVQPKAQALRASRDPRGGGGAGESAGGVPVRRGGAGLPSERDALRRSGEDRALVERLADKICELFPACPPGEANAIAICRAVRGSGRVGRSSAGRSLDDAAVTLAVIAFIRHRYTRPLPYNLFQDIEGDRENSPRGLRSLARLEGSAALGHRRAQRALLASSADRITGAAASLGSHTVDTAAHRVG